MALKDIELRILGCLVEKERTTPEQYPLTSNSLVLACNQKSNRDPVASYPHIEVEHALENLRAKGYVATIRAANERAKKHKHKMRDTLDISEKGLALLAVLMLRGKQTPGELRTRTERYGHFTDLEDVEQNLAKLESHAPSLVKNFGRGPGQSQDRWGHLLGGNEDMQRPRVRAIPSSKNSEFETLKEEVETLKNQLAFLYDQLDITPPEI